MFVRGAPVSLLAMSFAVRLATDHLSIDAGVSTALDIEISNRTDSTDQYELSIEFSGDTNAEAHHDLAITLLNGPDSKRYTQEAIRHFKRALEIEPEYAPAAVALAAMYEQEGDRKKAALYKRKAEEAQKKLGP